MVWAWGIYIRQGISGKITGTESGLFWGLLRIRSCGKGFQKSGYWFWQKQHIYPKWRNKSGLRNLWLSEWSVKGPSPGTVADKEIYLPVLWQTYDEQKCEENQRGLIAYRFFFFDDLSGFMIFSRSGSEWFRFIIWRYSNSSLLATSSNTKKSAISLSTMFSSL